MRKIQKLNTIENIKTNTVCVFAKSIGDRDLLRNQISASGMNAICFEKENTCIDNLKSILPAIVIVQTESATCAWRFRIALRLYGLASSLIILSEQLSAGRFKIDERILIVDSVSNFNRDKLQLKRLCDNAATGSQPGEASKGLFVGETDRIKQIRNMLPNISQSLDPVVIVGENGNGKEYLARLIAQFSEAANNFVKIDCSTLESDRHNYEDLKKALGFKGEGGLVTLLIVNIHKISFQFQNDLLLLVEELNNEEITDSCNSIQNVRLIVTAEHDLEELVHKGEFRKDLYYRLNVIPIRIPSLKERRQDISLLSDYFIIDACIKNNRSMVILSQKAREAMYMYDWPGNVDELRKYMQRVSQEGNESSLFANSRMKQVARNTGEYILHAASVDELPKACDIKDFLPSVNDLSLKTICDEFVSNTEKRLVRKALESTNWNRKKAAHLLNISYKSMLNKIKAYELS